MGAIHLRVVELEGNRQFIPEAPLSISSPNHERIVENATIHAYGAVNFGINDGRSADNHTFIRQVPVLATLGYLRSRFQVLAIELLEVVSKMNVAGRYLSLFVLDDGIDCQRLILNQFVSDREK